MIPALLLAIGLPQNVIELTKGAQIRPGYSYWSVEDTTLDASAPEENFGSSLTLLGGPRSTILIKFGDLNRAVGAGKRVKAAKLVLTPVASQPSLSSIARVLLPWGEGPMRPLLAPRPAGGPAWSATWKSRRAGETGGVAWGEAGATGSADAKTLSGTESSGTENEFIVDGLGPVVEQMRERWHQNHGFALRMSNACEFYSSQSQIGRPKLVIETEDAPAQTGADLSVRLIEATGDGERTYTAHIKNVGHETAKGFSAFWSVGERPGSTIDQPSSVAPGEEVTLTIRRSFKPNDSDHRLQPLSIQIQPLVSDANAANNALEIHESGVGIAVDAPAGSEDWVQQAFRVWNDVYSPESRFSFAPDGALERVRVSSFGPGGIVVPESEVGNDVALLRRIAAHLKLPDLSQEQIVPGSGQVALTIGSTDLYPGISGGGDTRYEGSIPGRMWFPYEPLPFEPFDKIAPEPTSLLSATEVASLNMQLGKTPRRSYVGFPSAVLLVAQDLGGRALSGTELDFFQSKGGRIDLGAPAFTVATNDQGIAILPKREGGYFGSADPASGDGTFLVRVQKHGVTGWSWLKAWQLADAYARGNAAVLTAELRFNVPGAPIESGVNLAVNRIVTDSTKSSANKLSAVVDDNPATAIDLPAEQDSWLDIDLGRDRTIGEIRLIAGKDMWRKFDILLYGTGQLPMTIRPAFQELNWQYTSNHRSDTLEEIRSVPYRTAVARYRYIRLVNRSGEAGRLNEIKVSPARIDESP